MHEARLPHLPKPTAEKTAWLADARCAVGLARGTWRRRESLLSLCRLVAFALALAGFFLLWDRIPLLAGASLALGFAAFLVARRFHREALEQADFHARLHLVLDETDRRLPGRPEVIRSATRPRAAPDFDVEPLLAARERWALSPQEIDDLDLYGEPIGLFGLLNRASTRLGAARLARSMECPFLDARAIRTRQDAVAWLGDHADRRTLLLAAAAGLRGQDDQLDRFVETIRDAEPLPRWASHPATRTGSFTAIAAAVVVIAMHPALWLSVLFGLAVVNAPLLLALRRHLLVRIRPWLRLDVVSRRLATLSGFAATILPENDELGAIRGAFERASARPVLPALAFRIPYLFLGFTGALHKVVNALTLWDLHWICALQRSYLPHRKTLLGAIEALAELEVILSFSAFRWEQPASCLPEIRTDAGALRIAAGYHPLLPADEAVANDLDLELPMRVWIITGSNMSGKSTYLRMVGVNMLLAQCGCAVAAEAMQFTPSAILSDLRIRDDLGKHESYFLAEVRQVKRILDHAGGPRGGVLGLIDEPFRGTNSEERLAAATAVIEALIGGHGFYLVATHDQQVTRLADDRVVANRHFQESLNEDVFSFDFRNRPGPATARNAIRVLEAEGYPPRVVASARRIADGLGPRAGEREDGEGTT